MRGRSKREFCDSGSCGALEGLGLLFFHSNSKTILCASTVAIMFLGEVDFLHRIAIHVQVSPLHSVCIK